MASGEGHGGGLCVWSEPQNSDTTVDANLFTDNRAVAEQGGPGPSDGGACYFDSFGLTFTNNVVAGNSADLGGGLYLPFAQDGVVTNNTLVGNSDAAIVVDQYNLTPITITNNIVVSHTVGISVTQGVTATVSYTLWHANGADIAGAGVVNQTHPVMGDPAFVDPAADDYHLTIASAARDAGDPAGVPPRRSMTLQRAPAPGPARGHRRVRVERALAASADGVEISHPASAGPSVGRHWTRRPSLHTTDGGLTWDAQGDLSAWTASRIPTSARWTIRRRGRPWAAAARAYVGRDPAHHATAAPPGSRRPSRPASTGGMKSVKGLSRAKPGPPR